MNIIEEIQSKVTFNIEVLIQRLRDDFKVESKNDMQVSYVLHDTLNIILNAINQQKLPKELYTTLYRMTKDYWYLNGYNKYSEGNGEDSKTNVEVKSIKVGDTTTTFADTSTQVEINGITYNTGTINFSEDALVEKYKKELYKFRKMRW